MKTIQHDIIARVSGPGWNYNLARILFATDGTAAVFIPPGDKPVQEFTFSTVQQMRGTGTATDGSQVTWQRRGSSCSFALATCNVKTPTLLSRWES